MDLKSYKTYIKFTIEDYLENNIDLTSFIISIRAFRNTNNDTGQEYGEKIQEVEKICKQIDDNYKRLNNTLITLEEFKVKMKQLYNEL